MTRNQEISLRDGVAWNLGAFLVMGMAGVGLNVLIARYYGAAALGVFNQVFAIYIVFSQIAVLGVWFSALKHVAQHAYDIEVVGHITTSAIVLAVSFAAMATLIGYLLAPLLGLYFQSAAVESGWMWALIGFGTYSVNKIWLAILNGLRDMRAYALTQILRYCLMLCLLALLIHWQVDAEVLPIVLAVPELFLFIFLSVYCRQYFNVATWRGMMPWFRVHMGFGLKSFPSGVLGEMNTRVDVLVLGYFVSDKMVGLYSMAAMVAEGLAQTAVALRDNLNPLITRYMVQGRVKELERLLRKSIHRYYIVIIVLSVLAIVLYPAAVYALTKDTAFSPSHYVFIILALGLMLGGGYLPLSMFLVQAGYPSMNVLHKVLQVGSVLVLCMLLVPLWGVNGAAIAMAAGWVLSAFYLKWLAKRFAQVSL